MNAKKRHNHFSNFEPGYAEAQLAKLRKLRQRLHSDIAASTDTRLRVLETFNDYQERQRVGGVK